MYIRTPKKYRRVQRRSIFPWKRLFFMMLALVLIGAGVLAYQNADVIRPMVMDRIDNIVSEMESNVATISAPTATPTENPTNILINADNFWDVGSVSEALTLYTRVLNSVPNDATIYTKVVTGYISMQEFERALTYAEDVVTADPYSSDAWAARAWALDFAGDTGGAIVSALHAQELDEQNVRATAWLAEAYVSAGQVQRALTTAERAIELDPNSPEAYRARAMVYWLGQFDRTTALQDLQTAFDLALANNPSLIGLIAVDITQIQIGLGNFDAAIIQLERVLELNPENTSALFWMGYINFTNLGDPAQASTFVTRCVEVDPENIGCNYMLGRTQMSLEQTEAAAQSFIRAVNGGSSNPRHWWWAARGQQALGRCDSAAPYLQTGYPMAVAQENTELVEDYDYLLQQCDVNPGFSIQPTATPEAEITVEPDTNLADDA